MDSQCRNCWFGKVLEPWRKQARNKLPGTVIECQRMPMPVLKLPEDFCGEFQQQKESANG